VRSKTLVVIDRLELCGGWIGAQQIDGAADLAAFSAGQSVSQWLRVSHGNLRCRELPQPERDDMGRIRSTGWLRLRQGQPYRHSSDRLRDLIVFSGGAVGRASR